MVLFVIEYEFKPIIGNLLQLLPFINTLSHEFVFSILQIPGLLQIILHSILLFC